MPKLTQAYVDKVKWKGPADRDTHKDDLLPGFYLIVTKTQHASYHCWYRVSGAGKQSHLVIGNARQIGLAEARGIARDAFAAAAKGIDRQAEKIAARSATPALSRTFEVQAKEFIKRHVAGQRTAKETEQAVGKLIEVWGNRQLVDISKADVLAHLDEIQDAGHPRARDRRRQLVKKLFDWLLERELVAINPAAGIKKLQAGGVKRQRVLTDDELRAIWRAAEAMTPAGANLPSSAEALVKLLMATGQRRGEVATIEWPEIDAGAKLWTVPPEKFKNGMVHLVPLPQLALDVLAALPRFTDAEGKVRPFAITTTSGERPVSSFADIKEELDRLSGVTGWVLHDIRRTVRTGLSKIGVNADVAERIIGHLPQGIRSVYDRHDFLEEKRAGLERWVAHLAGIVAPRPANVVPMRKEGAA